MARPNDLDLANRAAVWDDLRARLTAKSPAGNLPGERAARLALRAGVDAYRDLTGYAKEASAHRRMHRYGEFVSGLFGCWMKWDPELRAWFDTCALSLAHNPYGMSVGFTATWLCSICRADLSECEHVAITPYNVGAERYVDGPDEKCSICHEAACHHVVGARYDVWQSRIMTNPVMHETSITPKPREPRARISEIEMDPQPPPPATDKRMRCRRCLSTCGGHSTDGDDLAGILVPD